MEFEAQVDRAMCAHCKEMLPFLGLELGNPEVTFICPGDVRHVMFDGGWDQPRLANRRTYFASQLFPGWLRPDDLKPYFFASDGKHWFDAGGNDTASLVVEGLFGTEALEPRKDRVDEKLVMWGHPEHGVLFEFQILGGGHAWHAFSKGDLSRLGKHVRNLHNDPLPVGLFVSFERAFEALVEFTESGGAPPKSIEWIEPLDLPEGIFPEP